MPPPLPLPGGATPPRTGAEPSPRQLRQPPAEVRLHPFLWRDSAEGCLLLGCEREKVRDHLAGWARPWNREPGRVGRVPQAPAAEGEGPASQPPPGVLGARPSAAARWVLPSGCAPPGAPSPPGPNARARGRPEASTRSRASCFQDASSRDWRGLWVEGWGDRKQGDNFRTAPRKGCWGGTRLPSGPRGEARGGGLSRAASGRSRRSGADPRGGERGAPPRVYRLEQRRGAAAGEGPGRPSFLRPTEELYRGGAGTLWRILRERNSWSEIRQGKLGEQRDVQAPVPGVWRKDAVRRFPRLSPGMFNPGAHPPSQVGFGWKGSLLSERALCQHCCQPHQHLPSNQQGLRPLPAPQAGGQTLQLQPPQMRRASLPTTVNVSWSSGKTLANKEISNTLLVLFPHST